MQFRGYGRHAAWSRSVFSVACHDDAALRAEVAHLLPQAGRDAIGVRDEFAAIPEDVRRARATLLRGPPICCECHGAKQRQKKRQREDRNALVDVGHWIVRRFRRSLRLRGPVPSHVSLLNPEMLRCCCLRKTICAGGNEIQLSQSRSAFVIGLLESDPCSSEVLPANEKMRLVVERGSSPLQSGYVDRTMPARSPPALISTSV